MFPVLQAQFLNLLLCRCFQLSYLDKHPEEGQDGCPGSAPHRNPSLLNHGVPLSVSALVSFRRAPFLGLLPGAKVCSRSALHTCRLFAVASFVCPHQKKSATSYHDPRHGQDEAFASSPSLVRKKAMRAKVLRSGAYRSFTFTPLKQRNVQERLNASQGEPAVLRASPRSD